MSAVKYDSKSNLVTEPYLCLQNLKVSNNKFRTNTKYIKLTKSNIYIYI